eukprot:5957607-Pyramimonas_sp.AAC.1
MTFRKHFPEGFEFQTPEGPESLRRKPLRDAGANKDLTISGKIRGELGEVVKSSPALKDWSIESSVSNGFIFAASAVLGDVVRLYNVPKPASPSDSPRVLAVACHFT